MKAKEYLVYRIFCTKTETSYIGRTGNFKQRKFSHIYALKNGTHSNRSLQIDFNLYGEDCFSFEIIAVFADFESSVMKEFDTIRSEAKRYNYVNGPRNIINDIKRRTLLSDGYLTLTTISMTLNIKKHVILKAIKSHNKIDVKSYSHTLWYHKDSLPEEIKVKLNQTK